MTNDGVPSIRRPRCLPKSITGRFILQSVRQGMDTGKGAPVAVGSGGRYVLVQAIGRGGMGIVYRAWDTTLERDVALKVVSTREHQSDKLHRLLLNEARALAKVHHANVVEIYDVVADSDELFLTMPYIPGPSLSEWQRQRSPASVVVKYIAAARGLAAAHGAGVVHRDFKPSNVIVDADGQGVFVIDFGLAHALEQSTVERSGSLRAGVSPDHGSMNTMICGTLPYVAPELMSDMPATAASDQYAFCVALWQGITGEFPFGPQPREPGSPSPSRPPSMPSWLYRAICRGVSVVPDDRFASMSHLIAKLERGRRQRVRFSLAAVALGVVTLVGTANFGHGAVQPCVSMAAPMDTLWNDDARDRVRRALARADRAGMRTTAFALEVLEAGAQQWRDSSVASCEAQASAPESVRAMNQRACLDAQLAYFGDTLARIEQLGPRCAAVIHELLEPLTQTDRRCAFLRPLVHERTRRTLREIDLARAERNYKAALELAEDELARVGEFTESCTDGGESSVERGELRFVVARVRGEQEMPMQALAYLDRVDIDALDCGHHDLLARSNILRAQILALDLGDADSAQQWLDAGVAGYRQLGGFGVEEPEVHKARAFVALTRDLAQEAIDHYRAAIESLPRELAAKPHEAKLLVNIGAALHEQGEYAAAEQVYQQAIECVSEALGPEHPETRARRARVIYNLGIAAIDRGDEERGEALISKLEGLTEPVLALQVRHILLRHILGSAGRSDEARTSAETLASELDRVPSVPTRVQAEVDMLVGQVLISDGDPRGLFHLERALRSWEQLPDARDHRDLCELNYVEGLVSLGRLDEAGDQLTALFYRLDGDTLDEIHTSAADLAEQLRQRSSPSGPILDHEVEPSDAPAH
ncbi:MAG: serine/threonine-protein kinase [Myxococcota bacterium]